MLGYVYEVVLFTGVKTPVFAQIYGLLPTVLVKCLNTSCVKTPVFSESLLPPVFAQSLLPNVLVECLNSRCVKMPEFALSPVKWARGKAARGGRRGSSKHCT